LISIYRAAVTLRVAKDFSQVINPTIALSDCFGRDVRWATKAAATNSRKFDHQCRLGNESHFARAAAEQIEQRRLAGNDSARRQRKNGRNSRDARHGNMHAVRIHGPDDRDVRIHLAEFSRIDSSWRAGRDFDKAHVRAEVDHARINGQTARVDFLRAGGS